MIKIFNLYYFFFIILEILTIIICIKYLKSKSKKFHKNFMGILLIINLINHFLKLLYSPYTNLDIGLREIFFTNICSVSILLFPFFFYSKVNVFKDFIIYLGVISGFLALIYPTEALNKNILTFDVWRFYLCHFIIFLVPILMLSTRYHQVNYHNIYKIPFILIFYYIFIIFQQIIQSELGIISLRNEDFFDINYRNPSLIWGPTDDISIVFKIFTPKIFKVVPYGVYRGQEKYWPFFWLLPATFIYFTIIPSIMCIFMDRNHIRNDFINMKKKLSNMDLKK